MELKSFEIFLGTLRLDPELRKVKTVEMDLRGELNPTILLDELFFVKKEWLGFNKFYYLYLEKHGKMLKEKFSSLEDLKRGLQARLYRTQCGFLTEYHGYLMAQKVFGKENVVRSKDLDKKGVDFQIKFNNQLFNIHVFVDSFRSREFRKFKSEHKHVDDLEGIHLDLPYSLDPGKINSLRFLDNGFGVFTEECLLDLKEKLKTPQS